VGNQPVKEEKIEITVGNQPVKKGKIEITVGDVFEEYGDYEE